MKALTLYQPWAWSIVAGPKRIENRPWKPWPEIIGKYIALHAGKTYDDAGADYIRRQGLNPPGKLEIVKGAIVGVARVAGYRHIHMTAGIPEDQRGWFFGPFGWLLEDVRAVAPWPCKGAMALWDAPAEFVRAFEGDEEARRLHAEVCERVPYPQERRH